MKEEKEDLLTKSRIVFMGTPEFAVPSLEILIRNGLNVVGVVTAVDKLGGRGRKKVLESAIKKFAKKHDLCLLQPRNLKAPSFVEELIALKADLQLVVAFRMLPEVVWSMPPLGTINLHGSLLPKYRGAAPINWAIIQGETETGLTTFFIQHKIDTGDLLFQKQVPIYADDTAGDLHDRMMYVGADLLLETTVAVFEGKYQTSVQDDSLATRAPKLKHESCQIDLNRTAPEIRNFIRGMNPWPVAWLPWHDAILKVHQAGITDLDLPTGQIKVQGKQLLVGTRTNALSLEIVQLPGRKRMKISDFLNGVADLPLLVESRDHHLS